MKNLNLFFLMIAVIAMVACGKKTDKAKVIEQQKELTRHWDKALNTGDADALAAFYPDDGIRMNPNEPAWVGKEAIRNGFRSVFEKNIVSGTNKVVDVIHSGDYAIVRGTYSGMVKSKTTGNSGNTTTKWVSVNKQQPDGSWKMVLTIWNSDLPSVSAKDSVVSVK